jgi:hypothetical protein
MYITFIYFVSAALRQVIAMFPWHVNWLPAGPLPCDMKLGATDIPGVVAELETIARWIKANNSGGDDAKHYV